MTSNSEPIRIIQISDTHLSRRRPFFQHNWELLVDLLGKATYDLIVCTGDMSVDGAAFEDELAFAARQFERIKGPVLFVPGNHDVGNSIPDVRGGETVITSVRRDAYIRHFGPDFWTRDIGTEWCLVGLNSMLPGSGIPGEAEQLEMIGETARRSNGRRLILFKHKPLYMKTANEEKLTQGALYPEHRARLRKLLAPARRSIICSGHIHDYKTARWGGLAQIWAPSTAFVIDRDGLHNPRYGVRRVGYLAHTLDGAGHSHAFIEPDQFINTDLGNWMRAPEGFHARYGVEPLRGLALAGNGGIGE
jgi:3',5'-cyclic AMP phosphodiesterase CpdA